MDKEDVVYIHNGILLSRQKGGNLAICNDVDGTRVFYAKRKKLLFNYSKEFDFKCLFQPIAKWSLIMLKISDIGNENDISAYEDAYGKKYLKIRLSDDRTFQTFARNNEDNREE